MNREALEDWSETVHDLIPVTIRSETQRECSRNDRSIHRKANQIVVAWSTGKPSCSKWTFADVQLVWLALRHGIASLAGHDCWNGLFREAEFNWLQSAYLHTVSGQFRRPFLGRPKSCLVSPLTYWEISQPAKARRFAAESDAVGLGEVFIVWLQLSSNERVPRRRTVHKHPCDMETIHLPIGEFCEWLSRHYSHRD